MGWILTWCALGCTSAMAHNGDLFVAGYGTPTIDGVEDPGEWDQATAWPIFNSGAMQVAGSEILFLNDEYNLYVLMRVTDPTLDAGNFGDRMELQFDSTHDGTLTNGDDQLWALVGDFRDEHWNKGSWDQGELVSEGGADASQVKGVGNTFELWHPLWAGAFNDLAVNPGDTVGVCIRYYLDGGNNSRNTTFPVDCWLPAKDQGLYVDLELAPSIYATGGSGSTTTPATGAATGTGTGVAATGTGSGTATGTPAPVEDSKDLGCGCSGAPAGAGWLFLVPALMIRRRR